MDHLRSMWRQASERVWYHGTVAELDPGEVLVPGVSRNYRHSDPDAVSITSDFESAVYWAEQVSWKTGRDPVVYAVEPIGEVTPWRPGEARCPRARVIRRVAKQASGDVVFNSVSNSEEWPPRSQPGRSFGRTASLSEGESTTFGAYRLVYTTEDQGESRPRHVVTAYDGSTIAGRLEWYGKTGEVREIDVRPEHRRRGLATAMWEFARDAPKTPKHSPQRTDDGDAWVRTTGDPVPRRVQGASMRDTAHRGVSLPLSDRQGVPILEALVKRQTNVAARLIIDAMAETVKNHWWAAGSQESDEAGRWWTTSKAESREYSYSDEGAWMTLPVVMTAEFSGAPGDAYNDGTYVWHLPPGHPVTITEFEACLPDDPRALLDGWRGVTSPGNHDAPGTRWEGTWLKLPIPPMRTTAALSLEDVISVAEEAMERGGLAGRTIRVPTGHVDDPVYQAAIAPLVAWVRSITKTNVRFYASDYQLDREGGAQAMTDGYDRIVVRPVTTEMTVLHECAHVIRRSDSGRGHDAAFAALLHELYLTHLGERAADVFWNIVGEYV